ncbi:MAG: FAD-dependent oxidoreductase [Gammaproteobacteria bacterium]|nr:FAD-dependent oxidoreductase [Gammaproteobacteria bacterium]MBU1444003.1 FAD-dependent oxidoreductase [Gammaproteobacteria bacterium]MBU2286414.1 FAD-dependent oxidoreductase [Gammaproteobacteria bacterium]
MKRLVLLGGGHAHLAVLDDLARHALTGWDVQLVTPFRRQIYSGMLPGWVAGHYAIDACAIALDALCARAGVALHLTTAQGLDLTTNEVQCADGSRIGFDRLSIDTGPLPALDALPGAIEHALAIRPIEHFVARWPALVDRILAQCSRRFDLAILGAGAAGVELALAIHRRATTDGWSHLRITLVGSNARPLEGVAERARARIVALLKQRGVRWLGHRQATRLEAGRMHFAEGDPLAFDACLMVTGAAAPDWPRQSGLATDAQGFIRVSRSLQSVSHPQVIAAGDVAAYADARPKSGVFAVRAGPVLADHLRALCEGRSPGEWTPQPRALYLISTGDRRAIAAWGRWAWAGALEGWVWRWKDRIDRRFVARFGSDA